jgi:2,3-bisphosphoglycerate-independent phosphoglycerate mutase
LRFSIRKVKESGLVDRILKAYKDNECDETLEPIIVADDTGKPVGRISNGDTVIFYDIRGEREVELTRAFTDKDFSIFPVEDLDLNFITMIEYNKVLDVKVAFPKVESISDTLSETLGKANRKHVKIVESEKAIHIKYFLNGKNKDSFDGEDCIIIPTPTVGSNYNENPEMAAVEVANATIEKIEDKQFDVIITNLANVDVVGHIEDKKAIIKAVEVVDHQIGKIINEAIKNYVTVILTADHGTVERWYYPDGKIDTGHTNSPVPFLIIDNNLIDKNLILRDDGDLADVSPTILHLLGIDKPTAMTGWSLIKTSDQLESKRLLLLIIDGWGLGKGGFEDLIAQSNTPNMDKFLLEFPNTTLRASGTAVGLPEGTVGNSEAGHLHIGSGRRVDSDRVRIDNSIDNGDFYSNEVFLRGIKTALERKKRVHLLGIVSFFSSHGSLKHLYALMEMCRRNQVSDLFIHGMLGRRGERPEAGARYIEDVMKKADELGCGKVVTVIGRYWSLDREENWDRIEKTYNTLV